MAGAAIERCESAQIAVHGFQTRGVGHFREQSAFENPGKARSAQIHLVHLDSRAEIRLLLVGVDDRADQDTVRHFNLDASTGLYMSGKGDREPRPGNVENATDVGSLQVTDKANFSLKTDGTALVLTTFHGPVIGRFARELYG